MAKIRYTIEEEYSPDGGNYPEGVRDNLEAMFEWDTRPEHAGEEYEELWFALFESGEGTIVKVELVKDDE